jgi:hypothetical protein
MSVFVDKLVSTKKSKRWPFGYACHLGADTDQELMAFAEKIGLNKSWLQNGTVAMNAHFDLTFSMRRRAVAVGAEELSVLGFVNRIRTEAYKKHLDDRDKLTEVRG